MKSASIGCAVFLAACGKGAGPSEQSIGELTARATAMVAAIDRNVPRCTGDAPPGTMVMSFRALREIAGHPLTSADLDHTYVAHHSLRVDDFTNTFNARKFKVQAAAELLAAPMMIVTKVDRLDRWHVALDELPTLSLNELNAALDKLSKDPKAEMSAAIRRVFTPGVVHARTVRFDSKGAAVCSEPLEVTSSQAVTIPLGIGTPTAPDPTTIEEAMRQDLTSRFEANTPPPNRYGTDRSSGH